MPDVLLQACRCQLEGQLCTLCVVRLNHIKHTPESFLLLQLPQSVLSHLSAFATERLALLACQHANLLLLTVT